MTARDAHIEELGVASPEHRRSGASTRRRSLPRLIRAVGLLIALLVLVRLFVLAPFAIPSPSMTPAIVEGDVVLVNKLAYRFGGRSSGPSSQAANHFSPSGPLRRNDVVVF